MGYRQVGVCTDLSGGGGLGGVWTGSGQQRPWSVTSCLEQPSRPQGSKVKAMAR